MPQPLHNPFYSFLVAACAALLITMLVCVTMWVSPKDQAPYFILWIDRHWLQLIVGEVAAIIVFGVLTIGLDRFFERRTAADSQPGGPPQNEETT